MKKIEFLRLVCIELARMGVGEDEIKIQCSNIHKYLTSMGIGEESPALDGENPAAFAKLIYGNITKKQSTQSTKVEPVTEVPVPEEQPHEFSDEMPEIETIDTPSPEATDEADDVKIFEDSHSAPAVDLPPESDTHALEEVSEEVYNPFEEEDQVQPPENVNGTIEFDVASIKKRQKPSPAEPLKEEEDYFEKSDEEDYMPTGNPALFWVLVALTSFLWIPLAVLFFVCIGLGIALMVIFEAIYIPALVVVIIGGSAVSFAELIYSVIKFAGKNPAVALFELGLGFIVAALTVGLPAGIYYLGVSAFPKWIKNYGKNVKKLMKKLRRLYRKLKGVCSI